MIYLINAQRVMRNDEIIFIATPNRKIFFWKVTFTVNYAKTYMRHKKSYYILAPSDHRYKTVLDLPNIFFSGLAINSLRFKSFAT